MVQEQLKVAGDVVSISTVVATIAGLLPHIAALLTVIWSAIRLYETKTVQDWLAKRKQRKSAE